MNPSDQQHMARALELARRGEGSVEPNPMVGCVVASDDKIVGEGWHQKFGGPHAEVEALTTAGDLALGATLYVTLEPCCHQGKTPPCTQAIIDAGIGRVVVALRDPFPRVSGQGIKQLEAAGVEVHIGLLEDEARQLCAPYLKLVEHQRPWVIGKWAMTLDGKIATSSGESQWISGEASREVVHRLRGRVDAILVGRRTAEVDDPLLTARPAGPRTAQRIVLDTSAALSLDSQLVQTARDTPVLVAVGEDAPKTNCEALTEAGCEVICCHGGSHIVRLIGLLGELGRRRITNLLVEGGAQTLGSFLDAGQLDEVHVFLAPKILGGDAAPSPLAGLGIPSMAQALSLESARIEQLDGDVYISGRCQKAEIGKRKAEEK